MKRSHLFYLTILIAFSMATFAVPGCVTGSTDVHPSVAATPVTENVTHSTIALKVTGNVDKPVEYTLAELKSRPFKNITVDFKDNLTANITGFLLNDLLNDSVVMGNATNVTFSSDDGYVKTIMLSDIRASPDSMLIFGIQLPQCCPSPGESNDTLKDIVPGQPYDTWVGNLGTIEVQ
jgi:hypothetical protein